MISHLLSRFHAIQCFRDNEQLQDNAEHDIDTRMIPVKLEHLIGTGHVTDILHKAEYKTSTYNI